MDKLTEEGDANTLDYRLIGIGKHVSRDVMHFPKLGFHIYGYGIQDKFVI